MRGVLSGLAVAALVVAAAVGLRSQSASIKEDFLPLPGAKLFYIDTGGPGIPVVFLHANTGSSRVWQYQIPVFTAAGYRFLSFDRRGWGRTEAENPPPDKNRSAADDLVALLDHLKLTRVHLVGTAGGAFVALDFALSYPQRLRSLVVANSIGGVQDPEFLELNRRLRPPQFDALPPEIRELGPSYRAADPKGTERWMELEKISRPPGPPAAAQPLRNPLSLAGLQSIATPTLLIAGGADMFAPPAVMKLFAARIKNSEFLAVPDAGHSTYWEQPEVFNRAVLSFLARHKKP